MIPAKDSYTTYSVGERKNPPTANNRPVNPALILTEEVLASIAPSFMLMIDHMGCPIVILTSAP